MARRIRATSNLERVPLRLFIVLAFVLACCPQAVAEDPAQTSSVSAQAAAQNASSITAVPNRPTFSTTAETVQRGVFEIEYGYEAASGHQNINGLLGSLKRYRSLNAAKCLVVAIFSPQPSAAPKSTGPVRRSAAAYLKYVPPEILRAPRPHTQRLRVPPAR